MKSPIIQVNAFTNRPFAGNPAAVCILSSPQDDKWMQHIAIEMNLSETAFIYKESEDHYQLRWFTVSQEEDLCGHATLASAHVLWEEELVDPKKPITFHSRSGPLTAHREGDHIRLDFPEEPITTLPTIDPALQKHYGDIIQTQGFNRLDHFLELTSEEAVLAFQPEVAINHLVGRRGLIISSRYHRQDVDFVSRFFAPVLGHGIPEDPVTGSAHCALGPYWAERIGKKKFSAFQASARGGHLRVELLNNRVHLLGQAVTIWKGTLEV
ncbi:phenazine biosynthesis protein PhzF family [Marininema mesophilum]|uniref:Phenazine biosynthesis protein PhzF family n=1 Tax=Marininema mesophilum TaxID=1048340 RepID=A0A1H2QQG4_9BACL|nr:PhzF family phenazine biosynthesis protein [Marininema mesophilum]SDW08864.1 phenazine biosynthesis protein PhzF family [Marininema mesophilum]